MSTEQSFVDHVLDQFGATSGVTAKKMFGEYGLFLDGKMFALICDNRLFVKPTTGGRSFIGNVVEDSPYPGAKPCFVIEEQLENRSWLLELASITVAELPAPKPKRKK